MRKRCKNKHIVTALSAATAVVLGLVMFIPVAQAETPYDITACGSGTVTVLSQSKELTVASSETRGISESNHENKVFDNCSFYHVRIVKIEAGKWSAHGYTKFMDPDGDILIVEFSQMGEEATTKFLQGTGKWKGITGGGKVMYLTPNAKPIAPGTIQGCYRQTGTFELPK
jgi:hypothetical protein